MYLYLRYWSVLVLGILMLLSVGCRLKLYIIRHLNIHVTTLYTIMLWQKCSVQQTFMSISIYIDVHIQYDLSNHKHTCHSIIRFFLDYYQANHSIINRGVYMYNRSCSVEDVVFSFVSINSHCGQVGDDYHRKLICHWYPTLRRRTWSDGKSRVLISGSRVLSNL